MLLFLIVNIVFVTVEMTVSKIFLLLLVAALVFKAYKFIFKVDSINYLIISTFDETRPLEIVAILSKLLSILFQKQDHKTHLCFISIALGLALISYYLSFATLTIIVIDFALLLEIKEGMLVRNEKKLMKKLGIRQTQSIYFNSFCEPSSSLKVPVQ